MLTKALRQLHDSIIEQHTALSDAFFIVTEDFNLSKLKTLAQRFYQHINFANFSVVHA